MRSFSLSLNRLLPMLFDRQTGSGRVLGAMMTVACLTLAVKVVSAVKEVEVARSLGLADSLDAFYIAFLIPGIIVNIIGASLNTALIPTYIRVREEQGPGPAYRLYSSMMICSLALLLGFACLLCLSFPLFGHLFGATFGPAKMALTRSLFLILVPVILLTGVSTTWGAVLNATDRFALVAVTPMITPLAVVAALGLFGRSGGVYTLAWATLSGALIEAAVLGIGLRRLRVPLGFRWYGFGPDLTQVLRQYAPVAAGALILSGTSFVDQTLAARLGSGAVASLAYGYKIVAFVVGIGVTAVGSSVLPHFSRLVAACDWAALRSSVRVSTIVILCATVPIACLLWVDSAPFVRLVFQHGAFTATDTRIVGRVQAAFALGIPAYTLAALYMRLIAALRLNQRIFFIAGCNVVLNFVLDVIFARFLGVAGIALSTTFVSLSSCVAFYFALRGPLARAEAAGKPEMQSSDLALSSLPTQEAGVFGLAEAETPREYIAAERRAS